MSSNVISILQVLKLEVWDCPWFHIPRKWWSWDLNTMLLTEESLLWVNMPYFFLGSLLCVHV